MYSTKALEAGRDTLKPILKWAGGKRWLVPILKELWHPYAKSHRLSEPFLGGMSVALGLNPKKALLNDANPHLIHFYQNVQKGLVIKKQFQNNATYYYEMRDRFNELIHSQKSDSIEAASIFYFLIRTGYNGLCRFNSEGRFNVPFGSHNRILYKTDFLEYQDIFKNWQFKNDDFESLKLKANDFLYADPPYDVEFTKYHSDNFTWEDQLRLAKWLSKHKGPVIASNQATDRILELYKGYNFQIYTLEAPRRISCTGDRSPALEMLALKNIPSTLKL